MMDCFRGNNPETTRPHRKTPSFHIEGILGLDQASRVDNKKTPSSPTPIAVPVEIPATHPPRVRRRRPRIIYSPLQVESLQTTFAVNQYPDIYLREVLADALDMTEARVLAWFQNRRARRNRQAKRKASSSSPSDDTVPSAPRNTSPVTHSNSLSSNDSNSSPVSSPSRLPRVHPFTGLPSSPTTNDFRSTSSSVITGLAPTMYLPTSRCTDVCCSPPPFDSQVCCSPDCSPDSPPSATTSTPVCCTPTPLQCCYPGPVYPSSYFLNYQGLSTHTRHGAFYPYYHQHAAYHPGAGAHTSHRQLCQEPRSSVCLFNEHAVARVEPLFFEQTLQSQ